MAHAVFALSPAHHDCVQALLSAGFRPDEINVVPAALDATLPAQGTLNAVLRGVASSLAQSLTAIGVPLWAAHRFETALIGGVALIGVTTANAYEVDTIAALLHDGGCEHVVACVTVPATTPDAHTPNDGAATMRLPGRAA